jgi:hypothetical protein
VQVVVLRNDLQEPSDPQDGLLSAAPFHSVFFDRTNATVIFSPSPGSVSMAGLQRPSTSYAAFLPRFSFATFAACFPSAVLVALGKCAIVRFFLAALAALRMFLRAALRCFSLGIVLSF